MAIFRCKSCGDNLNVTDGVKVVECESCGTRQTVPAADNEKKVNLFNRANRLRMECEFSKAESLYEQICTEFPDEAEAYWGLCLCRYGIEYVDDPKTGKKVPTCHRSSFESIFDCEDYQNALDKCDVVAREVYKEQATEIDRLNREIQKIARNEQPYDVFICYKETDSNKERTKDSVRAQEVYNALTKEGYKVFFSRITLEDKLGQEYEPYIFSALNTAKVMLVIGSSYENFEAVWVKNEWTRFLDLMTKDNSKKLYPCYFDIDPYDLPGEFRMLQGQSMDKIGFEQDLVRNIQKIIPLKKQEAFPQGMAMYGNMAFDNLDRAGKNAEKLIELGNINGAREAYTEITKLHPESYLGWWGLIRTATNDFKTFNAEEDEKIKEWYGYVCKTATEEEMAKTKNDYINYLHIVAESDMEAMSDHYREHIEIAHNLQDRTEKNKQEELRKQKNFNSSYEATRSDLVNQLQTCSSDILLVRSKRTKSTVFAVLIVLTVITVILLTIVVSSIRAHGNEFLGVIYFVSIILLIIFGCCRRSITNRFGSRRYMASMLYEMESNRNILQKNISGLDSNKEANDKAVERNLSILASRKERIQFSIDCMNEANNSLPLLREPIYFMNLAVDVTHDIPEIDEHINRIETLAMIESDYVAAVDETDNWDHSRYEVNFDAVRELYHYGENEEVVNNGFEHLPQAEDANPPEPVASAEPVAPPEPIAQPVQSDMGSEQNAEPTVTPSGWTCPNCGNKELAAGDAFCACCGTKRPY